MSGESETPVDYPRYGHLGKKIAFTALPPDVQKCTLQHYRELWDLPDGAKLETLARECAREAALVEVAQPSLRDLCRRVPYEPVACAVVADAAEELGIECDALRVRARQANAP